MALAIRLFSTKDWHSQEKGLQLFDLLATHGTGLAIEKFGPYGQASHVLSSDTLPRALEFWSCPPPGSLGFYGVRKQPLDLRVWVQWQYRESQRHNELNLWLDREYLSSRERSASLVELARQFYLWGMPDYSYVREEAVSEGRLGPQLRRGLPSIHWANFFGPVYVEFFGRAKFETVPAFHKEELPDGGFLLLTASGPFEHSQPAVQMLGEAIIDHLGRDAFFEKSHPERACRTPQFTFQQASLGQPIAIIAEDPVSKIIPDPQQFIEMAPFLAQKLCQRLKTTLDFSPDSLKQIDDFALKRSYRRPNAWDREADREIIRELTAYYGEVIRQQLDGGWGVARGSSGDLHPTLRFVAQGGEQLEYPFTRVMKLWEERQRADGLAIHFMLLASGEWDRLERHLRGLH